MKTYPVIFFLSLSILGCQNQYQEKPVKLPTTEENSSPTYKHVCDSGSKGFKFLFNESEPIYAQPDTASAIVGEEKFGEFKFSIKGKIEHKGLFWYETGDGNFIKSDVFHDYYRGQGDFAYVGKYIDIKKAYDDEPDRFYKITVFRLKKINRRTNTLISTFTSSSLYPGRKLRVVENCVLKNIDFMLHLESEFDACPGGFMEEYIIETDGKLKSLLHIDEEGYDGDEYFEFEEHKIYFPIYADKKIVLAPAGNFKNILKPDLSLDLIQHSPIDQIALEDLIIIQKTTSNNTNNNIREEKLNYFWDGVQLRLYDDLKE